MKNILAIISDPANSKEFIKYTYQMAKELNYSPHFLYIQDPTISAMSSGAIRPGANPIGTEIETDRKNAIRLIQEKIRKVRKELSNDVLFNFNVETGFVVNVINQYISSKKAEMVVLEGRDKTGAWTFDASNSDIIQKINCPGWMIPYRSGYDPYHKIVYATDYNETDVNTLKNLVNLTGRFSPEITALHISDSIDFEEKTKEKGFIEIVRKELEYDKIQVKTIVDKGKKGPGENINNYATDNGANLIVLLKENVNFIEKIFKPEQTKKVLKTAKLPVLVYQEQ